MRITVPYRHKAWFCVKGLSVDFFEARVRVRLKLIKDQDKWVRWLMEFNI